MITDWDQIIAYGLILLALGYGLTLTALVAVGTLAARRRRRHEARRQAVIAARSERELAAYIANGITRLETELRQQQGEQP